MIIEEGRLMVIARYLETNYFIKHSGRIQQEILLQSKSGVLFNCFHNQSDKSIKMDQKSGISYYRMYY